MAKNDDYMKLIGLAKDLSSFRVQPQTLSATPLHGIHDYKLADYQYEVSMKQIRDFEDKLAEEHEVAIQ